MAQDNSGNSSKDRITWPRGPHRSAPPVPIGVAVAAAAAAVASTATVAAAAAVATAALAAPVPAAAAAGARAAAGLGLVDGDAAAVQLLAVHPLDGIAHRLLAREGDEAEAAGPLGLTIEDDLGLEDLAEGAEGVVAGPTAQLLQFPSELP